MLHCDLRPGEGVNLSFGIRVEYTLAKAGNRIRLSIAAPEEVEIQRDRNGVPVPVPPIPEQVALLLAALLEQL